MSDGKWYYSSDEEMYYGHFDTKEEAIAELLDIHESGYVGQFVNANIEEYLDAEIMLENIQCQDQFGHESYEDMFHCTKSEFEELEQSLRTAFRQWVDRVLRPILILDTDTVEEVFREDDTTPPPPERESER